MEGLLAALLWDETLAAKYFGLLSVLPAGNFTCCRVCTNPECSKRLLPPSHACSQRARVLGDLLDLLLSACKASVLSLSQLESV